MCFTGTVTPLPGSTITLVHISRAAALNYLPTPFFFSYCIPSFFTLSVSLLFHFCRTVSTFYFFFGFSSTCFLHIFPLFCHLFCLRCLIFPLLCFIHHIIFLPLSRLFFSFFPYSSNNFFAIFILSAILDFIFSCFYVFSLLFCTSIIPPL